jgi:hypothetical protein
MGLYIGLKIAAAVIELAGASLQAIGATIELWRKWKKPQIDSDAPKAPPR